MARKIAITIVVGQVVSYKAAGKVSRLEGMAGKVVQGTVTRIDGDDVYVMPTYRKLPGALCPNMGAVVERKQVIA